MYFIYAQTELIIIRIATVHVLYLFCSSSASGADHLDHVTTQAPYAITAALFALVLGTIPAGLGAPPWISLIPGAAGL